MYSCTVALFALKNITSINYVTDNTNHRHRKEACPTAILIGWPWDEKNAGKRQHGLHWLTLKCCHSFTSSKKYFYYNNELICSHISFTFIHVVPDFPKLVTWLYHLYGLGHLWMWNRNAFSRGVILETRCDLAERHVSTAEVYFYPPVYSESGAIHGI